MTVTDPLLATELRLGSYIGRPLSPADWAALDRLQCYRLGLLAERERPIWHWDGRGDVAKCGKGKR